MAYYTFVKINDIEYNEYVTGDVVSSIGENNTSSNFTLHYENNNGRYTDLFDIGDEVQVWIHNAVLTSGTLANGTKLLTGIVEKRVIKGKGNKDIITITGRDYTARLQDITVQPEVYTSQLVEDIIEDIFNKYVEDVTYDKTAIGVTITRITFKHSTIFDSLKRLANLVNATFWVDADRVTHFVFKNTTDSGLLINNTNSLDVNWTKTRKELANQVWVYGDRYLDGYTQTFTADGIGSVFLLDYKPHSTLINVSGLLSKGGIANFAQEVQSGTQHLISFNDRHVIFVSGTNAGNNIPVSGVTISAEYDRDLPIVKFGRDRSSIKAYGLKEQVIIDKDIKDPDEAEDLMKSQLAEQSNPKLEGNVNLDGIYYLVASNFCTVNKPNDGVTNQQYNILEVNYSFDKEALLREEVIKVKLNKRIRQLTDELKDIITGLKGLRGSDIDETDLITRFEFDEDQLQLQNDGWFVKQRFTGSETLWGMSTWSGGLWDGSYDYARTTTISGGEF